MAKAISHYAQLGFLISIPMGQTGKYDLIVDDGTKIKRIQCKFTSSKLRKIYRADLRTRTSWIKGNTKNQYHSRYATGDFDELFILCDNGDKYTIPAEKIIEKSAVYLTDLYNIFLCTKNSQEV